MNEQYGHQAGDEVSKHVGAALRDSLRAYDVVARYGGDEFAIIALDAGEAVAADVVTRGLDEIHGRLGQLGFGEAAAATAASPSRAGDSATMLIARADEALLHGKHEGRRGTVVRASSLPAGDGGSGAAAASRARLASRARPRRAGARTPPRAPQRAPRSSSGLVASARPRPAALPLEHAEDRAAEQHRVARRGRELGPAALAQPAHDRGAEIGRLAR